ncbi:MAG: mechanosensitive ion channel [Acidobacteriota bacterium]|nr:MAG: mechanosensitive ion channel [Acidobacteriota bacterium]
MEPSELRRRLTLLAMIIAIVTLILIVLPFVEGWLLQSVYSYFELKVIGPEERIVKVLGKNPQREDVYGNPGQLAQTLLSLLVNLFKIIKVLLWMTIVIAVVRIFVNLIFGTALRQTAQNEIASLLKTVLSVIIYIVAFFIIFQTQYPNIPLAPLFTGSTILGIVVGLALQDTLGNLFSGIAIQADQSFQVGDTVIIGDRGFGEVESVSWRGVKIRTYQNKLLVMSNSVIGKEIIEIAPKGNLNARIVRFNTLYTNSPAKVIETVREVVRQVENVSPKRRPKVRIWNLGDSGIDWEVKYWITDYRRFNDTDARIRERIWYAFRREGLDFAYPTRTIYTAQQKDQESVFIETSDEICERINNVPVFAPLSTEDTKKIAQASRVRVFATEEPIIRMGQKGEAMYIIHKGSVNIQIREDGVRKTINTLYAGDFFGEMSLFTGEPRTADVVAESETKVIEIQPSVLKPILEENPELVRIISEIIDDRRQLLIEDEEEAAAATDADAKGVIRSIRSFFGLR